MLAALGDRLRVFQRALTALVLDRVVDPDTGATNLAEAFYCHMSYLGSFTRSRRPRRFATLDKRDEVHQGKDVVGNPRGVLVRSEFLREEFPVEGAK